ncbi:hypothetical protein DV515_00007109 [Chloebia gouldiae]|uniref:Uncharacterized protein n=9 Tax=Passeriformes TaxID=9126 RepID=A0A3L8SIM0_CHLGU|nr:hypothetical protein DV515_00007109 [Chloebia gouldiae]
MHICALIYLPRQAGTALSPPVPRALRGLCLFVELKQSTCNGAAHCKCQRCTFGAVPVAMMRKDSMAKAKAPLGDIQAEHSKENNELKEILLQSNSPGSTLRFAAAQKTSSSSSLPAGLHQEQKPEQSPDLLPLVLDPLEHAWLLTVAEGDADSIIKLLDLDPSLLTRRDFVTGFTALHWLAKHGHHESFIQVISHAQKKGYPVNMNIPTASGGLTPLHLAALQGHEVLIKVLVGAYGADTTCRDHNGRKAWQYLPAHTSRDLKELAGALEEDLVQLHSHNTNNNFQEQLWNDDSFSETVEKVCEGCEIEIIFIATEIMLKNETDEHHCSSVTVHCLTASPDDELECRLLPDRIRS